MLTVITGWSPGGYAAYGRNFLRSFDANWPRSVRLIVYGEQPPDDDLWHGISAVRTLKWRTLDSVPGYTDWVKEYGADPTMQGKRDNGQWKEKERAAGYSYRFDAVKFIRQGVIPLDAFAMADCFGVTHLCWLDADVVTYKPIPSAKFITELLPAGKDVAYLGRGDKHSEIGFQLYSAGINSRAEPMLREFSDCYLSGRVLQLREWHSAFVFDHARQTSGVLGHDLTPGGRGHVWFQSPLGQYMDHLKGDRKSRGASKERPR